MSEWIRNTHFLVGDIRRGPRPRHDLPEHTPVVISEYNDTLYDKPIIRVKRQDTGREVNGHDWLWAEDFDELFIGPYEVCE